MSNYSEEIITVKHNVMVYFGNSGLCSRIYNLCCLRSIVSKSMGRLYLKKEKKKSESQIKPPENKSSCLNNK